MTSAKQFKINPKSPGFGEKTHYLTKTVGKIGKQYWERLGLDQHLTPYARINSEWVNELNIKKEIINKLSEHRIVYLSDLWEREDFKIQARVRNKTTKSKINNVYYSNLKSFCTNKTNAIKIRREATNWGKRSV